MTPRTLTLLGAGLLFCLPSAAVAADRAVYLVAGVHGAVPRDRAVSARLGQRVRVRAVIRVGRGRRARYYADVPRFRLGGRLLKGKRVRPLSALGPLRWRWYRVEPRPHHVKTAPPNRGNPAYSNAVLFGRRHGAWLGYDTIEYTEGLIPGARGPSINPTRARPTHPRVDVNGGLGTMRYKVSVTLAGETLASRGMESRITGGISPKVMRVTFRSGDGLIGHLHGFFNVPNVFGSGGRGRRHQTDRFQGADCADVIIGAVRQAGYPMPYSSVVGLRRWSRPVTERLLLTKTGVVFAQGPRKGQPAAVPFGKGGVQTGDLMLIDYKGFTSSPRGWDHIAVVEADRGRRGRFDPEDPVLHMGYLYGLTSEQASGESPAYVRFYRFRPTVLRAIKRRAARLGRSARRASR